MRLGAGQNGTDHLRIGAVAADQPMPAEQPDIPRAADRFGQRLRHFVGVGEAAAPWHSPPEPGPRLQRRPNPLPAPSPFPLERSRNLRVIGADER